MQENIDSERGSCDGRRGVVIPEQRDFVNFGPKQGIDKHLTFSPHHF